MTPPVLYLFAGSNGAGKTTFARAYLTPLPGPPRFLNADEMARGLSPFDPTSVARKAGKLLLAEIEECIAARRSFGLESTLSGRSQLGVIERAKARGYQVEIHYLWIPAPELAMRRISQRVIKGGHHVPDADVIRRYQRSLDNFVKLYAPLADAWVLWDNTLSPPALLLESPGASLEQLKARLIP
ncbi:zeta toxin family protein [Haloferula sp. BvORR071]|uniref:zeta toxin family protein n=1 Tax=Haloferula sp. BvORR071 TaxID=1396141 RepID=UPI00055638CA|nr:zeta toxin family protein [Haloferula sp. BvORR071]